MPKANKRQIAARLSPDGYKGLTTYCASNGVSVTAYIDSLGQWLLDWQDGAEGVAPAGTRGMLRVVEHARAIDTQRRERGDRNHP